MRNLFAYLGELLSEVLTGISQIMLQSSAWVGAVFLAGMVLNSYILAILGVIGCLSGTLAARALKYPLAERSDGLYGFNGGLVGLGLGYFYAEEMRILILVVIGGALSAMITYRILRLGLRPFTFPFVLVTWSIMVVLAGLGWAMPGAGHETSSDALQVLHSMSRGLGQVLFQEHVATGVLFAAAIMLRNWVQGLYALLAAFIGLGTSYAVGFPLDAINLGLFGYNAVLCAVLFAGRSRWDAVSALVAVLLSVILVRLFHVTGLPALTFPFVLVSWTVLWARGKLARQFDRTLG